MSDFETRRKCEQKENSSPSHKIHQKHSSRKIDDLDRRKVDKTDRHSKSDKSRKHRTDDSEHVDATCEFLMTYDQEDEFDNQHFDSLDKKDQQRGRVQLLEDIDDFGVCSLNRTEFDSDEDEKSSRSKRERNKTHGNEKATKSRKEQDRLDDHDLRSRTTRAKHHTDERQERRHNRSLDDVEDGRDERSRIRRTGDQAIEEEENWRNRRTEVQPDKRKERTHTRRMEDVVDEKHVRSGNRRTEDLLDKRYEKSHSRRTEDQADEREKKSRTRAMEDKTDRTKESLHNKNRSNRTVEKERRSHARKADDSENGEENRSLRKRNEDQTAEDGTSNSVEDKDRDDDSDSSTNSNDDDSRQRIKIKSSVKRVEDDVRKMDSKSKNKTEVEIHETERRSRNQRDESKRTRDYDVDGTEDRGTAGKQSGVENEDENYMKSKRARLEDTLTTKTGGAYIPPARLLMMQSQITDKSGAAYQRLSWEALKKSINGLINKANTSNLVQIVRELFQENIIRGRGLLSRSIMQAQAASPTFTHVYAALVSIVNTKFPQIGELILRRLIIQFRKGYRRNDKNLCLSAARFIAHLVNQRVAHEVLSLEILHVLLESPTNDSVELAIGFLKECGQLLTKVSPKGVNAVFERLRTILHEAHIDKRVQYMVEVMFAVRKDGFKDHPTVVEELDIVEEDDQITHLLALENAENPEDGLNVFKVDDNFIDNNEKYAELKREILGESSDDDDDDAGSKSGSGDSDDSDSNESGAEEEKKTAIVDSTETNLLSLRRTIYLTIQSSLDFEECAHKLLKMQMKPGQEVELCNMILDCCSQQRTFEKFYGLLAQRFCMMERKYVEPFQRMFAEQYEFVHRLETNKLRNIAKLFAHLLHTDAISWEVLQCIHLNEDETTSSSRIFIKILFQELCEFMGLTKLNGRLKDQTLQVFFEGLFPRDNPRNTRFSINFFTSIGLGGLTDELRAHLKSVPKPVPQQTAAAEESSSSSSSDSDSSDSSDDSDSSSSSSSSSSEEETKPAPTRLSEFLNKDAAKADKRKPGNSNKESAQHRLFALANYGDGGESPPAEPPVESGHRDKRRHRHEDGDKDRDGERTRDDRKNKRVEKRRDDSEKKTSKRRDDNDDERRKSRSEEHKNKKRSGSCDRRR